MLIKKTEIKISDIHGLGLFAKEDIKKGEVVIEKTTEGLDLSLTEGEFSKLKKHEQDYIKHYGFKFKLTGTYYLTFDNTRFINHSGDGNITLNEKDITVVAKRDIKNGEEITQNYNEFDLLSLEEKQNEKD
ncbi:MAG: SET domain-containing protein [Patescibacteria group bacterium]